MNASGQQSGQGQTGLTAQDIQQIRDAANIVRGLSMDAVQQANSGHPGMPMGMADAAVLLWTRYLKHYPVAPLWADRDRFVLSAGHGSMLLYSLLHLTGYSLTLEDLKNFRQWGSLTPGHPENHITPGVETTTGPLGQGISNAVGMAMAEKWLATRFNHQGHSLIDHHTYVIASDGDLMEGISHESCSLAGHLRLSKLVVLYDDNGITIDGSTDLSFSEDVQARYASYGWHTMQCDGHDIAALDAAIRTAQLEERPSLLACKTTIGYGSPNRAGTAKSHGEPLGEEELLLSKHKLGLLVDISFYVSEETAAFMKQCTENGQTRYQSWMDDLTNFRRENPEAAAEFERCIDGKLTPGWEDALPGFEAGKSIATRKASGGVLNAVAPLIPQLIGGSADLSGSNNTQPANATHLEQGSFAGTYVNYGVREHGMGAIMNGMSVHGGIIPYGGTFLIFSDYMRASIRLAALMEQRVIYVFTHDSIGLGEDGPTHQPIEQLAGLRAIPNLVVFRPADANEVVEGWRVALNRANGPTLLALTRQGLPTLDRSANECTSAELASCGGYTLKDFGEPEVLLFASGSEVHIQLDAAAQLQSQGIGSRVISMPSWELFESQNGEYRNSVVLPNIKARISLEAGSTLGWSRYVGETGEAIGLDRFGASAPYKELYKQLGLTAEAVVEAAKRSLERRG